MFREYPSNVKTALCQSFYFLDQNQFQLKSYKDKHSQLAKLLSQRRINQPKQVI